MKIVLRFFFLFLLVSGHTFAQYKAVGWGSAGRSCTQVLNQPEDSIASIAAGFRHVLTIRNNGKVAGWGDYSNTPVNILVPPAGLNKALMVSAGEYFSMALRPDGTVVAWGSNDGYAITVPGGLSGVVAISAGSWHGMALKSNGTVVTWGGSIAGNIYPAPAGLSNVKAIEAGQMHCLALKTDGTVVAWGRGTTNTGINEEFGQCIVPAGLADVVAISGGFHHSMALKANGTVVCWGDNTYGQSSVPAGLDHVVAVSAGKYHSVALKADGKVVCWGAGSTNINGGENMGQSIVPPGLSDVKSIAAGDYTVVALKKNGTTESWGLVLDDVGPGDLKNIKAIYGGYVSSAALDTDGRLKFWGIVYPFLKDIPPGLSNIRDLKMSKSHVMVLKEDGTVVAWGTNSYGQLNVPAGLSGVVAIAVNDKSCFAVKYDGTLVHWGGYSYPGTWTGLVAISANSDGTLVGLKNDGTVTTFGNSVPAGLNNVIQVAAGQSGSYMALKSDGTVVAWGTSSSLPAGLTGVKQIAAGLYHRAALKHDGTVVSWGGGSDQLSSPTPAGISNVTYITCGHYHTLALTGNKPMDPAIVEGNLHSQHPDSCQAAPQNPRLKNYVVQAFPGPYYGLSDPNGNYRMKIPVQDAAAAYSVKSLGYEFSNFRATPVCPPSNTYTVVVDTLADTLAGKDFGYRLTGCHRMQVEINTPRRRRCFKNETYLSYRNEGAHTAPDAYLVVEFPRYVRPLTSQTSHEVVNDSVWRFNLGHVLPGQEGHIQITDSVLCGNVGILGQMQCTKATAYPAPDCPADSAWNGANVSISGTCHHGWVQLGIANTGTANMADSTDYWVYLDSMLVKKAKVKLAAGDSISLLVNAGPHGVYFTANQVPFHPSEQFVTTAISSCVDTVVYVPRPLINHFPIQQTPYSKTDCELIRGSYDPNDKSVLPVGITARHEVLPDTRLEYRIRFQNTGTDTAFTVVVIDTLAHNLNPETFEMGLSSHSYDLTMSTTARGRTYLKWRFNNIQLPDSNVNQVRSHGFVQFRVSPRPGLAQGSQVRNDAMIYFDFNPEIITNQTLTTFANPTLADTAHQHLVQVVVATQGNVTPAQVGAKLYPNPVANQRLTVQFESEGSICMYSMQGKKVFDQVGITGKQELDLKLQPGLYFAQLKTGKGVSIVKVVVL